MKIWKSAVASVAISSVLVAGFATSANAAAKQPKCSASNVGAVFTDSIGNGLTCGTVVQNTYITKFVTVKETVTRTKMVTKYKKEPYVVTIGKKQVTRYQTISYQVPVEYQDILTKKVPTQVLQSKTTYVWSVTKPFIPVTASPELPINALVPGQPTNLVLGGRGASTDSGHESFGGCFAITAPENVGSGIIGYEVGYSKDGGKSWKFVKANSTVNPVEPGRCELEFGVNEELTTSVVVAVRAVSSAGPGPLSSASFFMGKSL